ncbi:hypothetical protein GCM10027447_27840 [Glycomyces halotolerans]
MKYQVKDGDAAFTADTLAAMGVAWSGEVEQDDQAYAEPGWDYGQSKVGARFARLRTQEGRHVFTLKVVKDNEMACLEYETGIEDREQMDAALRSMGYRPTVRIRKRRRRGRWGELELCLDKVDRLGVFLEAELLVDDQRDGVEAQASLDKQISRLGVPLERVTDTYDSLLRAEAERH